MRIRAASVKDQEQLIAMRGKLWPEATLEELQSATMPGEVFVAEDEGGLIGFVEVSLRSHADGCETHPVGFLEGWYVEEGVRRRVWGGCCWSRRRVGPGSRDVRRWRRIRGSTTSYPNGLMRVWVLKWLTGACTTRRGCDYFFESASWAAFKELLGTETRCQSVPTRSEFPPHGNRCPNFQGCELLGPYRGRLSAVCCRASLRLG
jgi:hypothetical protein